MNLDKLLSAIPDKKLDFLSLKTGVDYQVKKLEGKLIFKLILYSMLETDKSSLRVMESLVQSGKFKCLANIEENLKTRHSSIRDRICTINSDFFEQIFNSIFKKYNKELGELNGATKVDSTYINISEKLISYGMKNGLSSKTKAGKKNIKFSVCMKGSLPCKVNLYTEQSYISEDLALPETIIANQYYNNSIMLIDRGVTSRKVFDLFNDKNILFIIRSRKIAQSKIVSSNQIIEDKNSTVKITKDYIAHLKDKKNKWTKGKFRIIEGVIIKTQEPIYWVSNVEDLNCNEIAALYKQRWEIETFFKFLKQHLNLNHLIVRNENGIKVMLYMTLILAILIIVYKKKNKIDSYKIAKLKMGIEINNYLIKEIVLICGGDPNKASHLWDTS